MSHSFRQSAVLALIFVEVFSACRNREGQDDSKVKRVQYTQAKAAESARIKCQSLADATGKNICFLAEYGKALLSQTADYDDISNQVREKLEQKGIKNFLPMSSYRISPKPGGTCFSERSYPLHSENFWNDQVEPVRKQIEHVAEFLAQYHVDLDGQDPGAFGIKDVELCPVTVTEGRKVALNGSTLTIGLPVKGVLSTTYGWYSFVELRKMWDTGDIFERGYSIRQATVDLFAGKQTPFIWMVGNPVGQVRNSLRQFLRVKGRDLIQKLESLRGARADLTPEEQGRTIKTVMSLDDASSESKQNYIPEVLSGAKASLEDILKAGKGKDLIAEWLCLAEKAVNSPAIGDAAIGGLVERSDTTNVNYDIKASWVAVANFHNINVDVLGAFSSQNRFIEAPRSSNQSLTFQVKAEGKVVVVTGDQVNVSTALNFLLGSVQRSIQSETLYRAVQNVATIPDRSQWCSSN